MFCLYRSFKRNCTSGFNSTKAEGITDPLQRFLRNKTRLRPVLMTAAKASLGILMVLSTSSAEVQNRLNGCYYGLFSATLLTLIVLPQFYLPLVLN
jgi:Cu/Ag efflux pump CusA